MVSERAGVYVRGETQVLFVPVPAVGQQNAAALGLEVPGVLQRAPGQLREGHPRNVGALELHAETVLLWVECVVVVSEPLKRSKHTRQGLLLTFWLLQVSQM